jgi:hypothetical protein
VEGQHAAEEVSVPEYHVLSPRHFTRYFQGDC